MSLFIGQTNQNPLQRKIFNAMETGTNGLVIYMVIDASGSMGGIKDDTIISCNTYIRNQLKQPNTKINVLTFNYNNKYICRDATTQTPFELNDANYITGGGTALNDAMGMAITDANRMLEKLPIEARPQVLICTITDGQENSSYSFTADRLKDMVKKCTDKDWAFTFLGANMNAFTVGASYGFTKEQTASFDTAKIGAVFAASSMYTDSVRSAKAMNLSASSVSYDNQTRATLVSKPSRGK